MSDLAILLFEFKFGDVISLPFTLAFLIVESQQGASKQESNCYLLVIILRLVSFFELLDLKFEGLNLLY